MVCRDVNIGVVISEWDRTRTLISSLFSGLTTAIGKGFEGIESVVETIWGEIEGFKEWDVEMTDLLLEKLETIRATNSAAGTTLGSKLDTLYEFAQLVSSLRTTQSAELLAELQRITEAKYTMEEAVVELRKIKLGTGLTIGVNLDEEVE